jgi:ClpP class serine protease
VPAFRLTPQTLLAHSGGGVVLIADEAIGRRHRLYRARPGPELNERLYAVGDDGEVGDDDTDTVRIGSTLTLVRISGVIEQRSDKHPCGHTEGHDTIAERLCEALKETDVLLVIDSPGGAHAGLQTAVGKVQACKREHNRRIIGQADEMIGSAAMWWAAAVCDEIYGPESCIVGSIGARAAHESRSRALKKSGVDITFFTWPNEGKVAFASELPLSSIGRERGQRDVKLAGEAFAQAIVRGRGLSLAKIVKLGADALPGPLAVKAGLLDGIATLEETTAYALKLSEGQPMKTKTIKKLSIVAESDQPDPSKNNPETDESTEDPETPPESEDSACDSCGAENSDDAKFCSQCGEPLESDDDDEEDGEETEETEEPSSDDEPTDPPPEKSSRHIGHSHNSIAEIVGLPATASLPTVKTTVLSYVELGRAVMSATGARSPSRALGQFKALAEEAASSAALRTENKAMRAQSNYRKRMDLLRQLATIGVPRGELFVDRIVGGRQVMSPAPLYASIKLGVLQGIVEGKKKSTVYSGAPNNPFAPSQRRASEVHQLAVNEQIAETGMVQQVAQKTHTDPIHVAGFVAELERRGAISRGGL